MIGSKSDITPVSAENSILVRRGVRRRGLRHQYAGVQQS